MHVTRRAALQSVLAAGAVAGLGIPPARSQELRHAKLAVGLKVINSTFVNVLIGERLGYNKAGGFHLDSLALGAMSSVFVALDKGDIDFGIVSPTVALPLYAKGELPPISAFYEYTYPAKWDITVKPDSPLQSYEQLRGKKIGVSNMGSTDYPVTRVILRNIGVDPDKDVTWIAVGEGVTAGVALERGAIDALAYFDTGFGTIEAAGIKMRYLPRPAKVPMIGGFFICAKRDFIKENRALCVALGRSVAMSTEYVLANPKAGAKAFLDMFPGNAVRGAPIEESVDKTVISLGHRMTLYRSPYGDKKLGFIHESEWREEADFSGLTVPDLKPLFTNDLIDEINDFDRAKVIAAAKAVKI